MILSTSITVIEPKNPLNFIYYVQVENIMLLLFTDYYLPSAYTTSSHFYIFSFSLYIYKLYRGVFHSSVTVTAWNISLPSTLAVFLQNCWHQNPHMYGSLFQQSENKRALVRPLACSSFGLIPMLAFHNVWMLLTDAGLSPVSKE